MMYLSHKGRITYLMLFTLTVFLLYIRVSIKLIPYSKIVIFSNSVPLDENDC